MPTERFTSLWYSLLSGVLLALATPLAGMWPLVFVALIPYFLNFFALHSTRKIVYASLLTSLPYCLSVGAPLFYLSGTWWLDTTKTFLPPGALGYFASVSAITFVPMIFFVLAALIAKKAKRVPIPPPITLGLIYSFMEFIRSSVFLLGHSWGTLGYLLIDAQYVKHLAALVGVYGLTFFVVFFNTWGAILIMRYAQSVGNLLSRLREVFFAERHIHETITLASLCIIILLFGLYRESQGPKTGVSLRVAVIASTIPTDESISEASYRTYHSLFTQALKQSPDLILAPENVFPYFTVNEAGGLLATHQSVYLENASVLYDDFLALTKEYPDTTFALGTHSEKNGLLYNSILLYRNGEISSVYHKRKLIPFTEYAPLGLNIPLFEQFTKGEPVQDFQMSGITLAGYICSEIDITPLGAHGATLILSPSNDSVFTKETASLLHNQVTRMRALEAGSYLLNSSKGGISSIIDPYGNIVAALSGKNGVLIADIH